MANAKRHGLDSQREFAGQKPGEALVKWLNDPPVAAQNFLEELLADAQAVFRCLADYKNLHELMVARKDGKLAAGFWECHQRLNEELAKFTHTPQIDLHEFYDGNRVSWTLVAEVSPIALLSQQVKCVVQLIAQGAILNIRRCQECAKWYFARFSHQEFCTASCRGKHFGKTEDFKQKRRDYMRDYYRRKKLEKIGQP